MKLYTFETGRQSRLGAELDGKLIDLNAACAARLGNKNAVLAPSMLELIRGGDAAQKRARQALALKCGCSRPFRVREKSSAPGSITAATSRRSQGPSSLMILGFS